MNTPEYFSIIENIKSEIRAAQYRATIHANSDLLLLYYDIGMVSHQPPLQVVVWISPPKG